MALTVFSDVLLPNAIVSAGVSGKQLRLNSRVRADNGEESINVIWGQTLRQYTLGTVPLRVDQWQALETLHEITEGGAYGVLMEDPKDRTVTNGVVTATATAGAYQLYKRYLEPVSGRSKDRKITRPRLTGFAVAVSGVALTAGHYTLNVNTGVLTIDSAPAANLVTWTGFFYVPVHFLDDSIDWTLMIAGAADTRFLCGPSVVLQEVRE